jgi:hypothetical protein
MANCGGCHSILLFKTEPEFLYLGELFFAPAKFKFEGLPSYREYNSEDKLVKEHFILDPKDEWFDPRSYYKRLKYIEKNISYSFDTNLCAYCNLFNFNYVSKAPIKLVCKRG